MKHAPDLIDLIRVQRTQCSPLGRNQATQPVQEHLGIQVLADRGREEILLDLADLLAPEIPAVTP